MAELRDTERQADEADFERGLALGSLTVRIARDPLLEKALLPTWERLSQKQRLILVTVAAAWVEQS